MMATIPPAWAAPAASLLLTTAPSADDPPPRDAARAAMTAQDWPGEIAAWGRAIAAAPDDVEARLGRGGAEVEAGDLAAAIADHTEAIRLDPTNALTDRGRALASRGREKCGRAVDDFAGMIRRAPEDRGPDRPRPLLVGA